MNAWQMQEAKARLSEVVKCAESDGPQVAAQATPTWGVGMVCPTTCFLTLFECAHAGGVAQRH